MNTHAEDLRAERARITVAIREAEAAERAQKTRARLLDDSPAPVRAAAWSLLQQQTSDEGRSAMRRALEAAVDADMEARQKRTAKARAARQNGGTTDGSGQAASGGAS